MRKKLLLVLGVLICVPLVLGVYAFVVTPKAVVDALPPKFVSGDANYVQVTGVQVSRSASQGFAFPWNAVCLPASTGECHMMTAEVHTSGFISGYMDVDDFIYEIVSYKDGRLVALDRAPRCATSTLTIDIGANSAIFVRRKRPDALSGCEIVVDDLFETEIVDGSVAINRMR